MADDVEGTIKDFADNSSFIVNAKGMDIAGLGEPSVGKPAIRQALSALVDSYRFEGWRVVTLLIDGETASLSWQARVTCLPTGKSETFDGVDIVAFKDGKITSFRQSTDTAMAKKISTPA
jgi:ketosteroid isomerase-like protein